METTTKSKSRARRRLVRKKCCYRLGGRRGARRMQRKPPSHNGGRHDHHNARHLQQCALDRYGHRRPQSRNRNGRSVQDAAEFLCRSSSIDDVRQKCEELGLKVRVGSRASPQGFRTPHPTLSMAFLTWCRIDFATGLDRLHNSRKTGSVTRCTDNFCNPLFWFRSFHEIRFLK